MSILDCNEDFLESWENRLSIMKSWCDTRFLGAEAEGEWEKPFVLQSKYYQYTEDERNWLRSHNIEHLPFEIAFFIALNPFSNGIDANFFSQLKEVDSEEPIVLVIKPGVIPAQLEPNIKFITIEDLKPNKLKGSPYFS